MLSSCQLLRMLINTLLILALPRHLPFEQAIMALERPAILGLLEDLHRFAKGQPPAPTSVAALGPDPRPFLPYIIHSEALNATQTLPAEMLALNLQSPSNSNTPRSPDPRPAGHFATHSALHLQKSQRSPLGKSVTPSGGGQQGRTRPSSAPRASRMAEEPSISMDDDPDEEMRFLGGQEAAVAEASPRSPTPHLTYNTRPLGSRALAASGYVVQGPPSAAATHPRPVSAGRVVSRPESLGPSPPQQPRQQHGYVGASKLSDHSLIQPQQQQQLQQQQAHNGTRVVMDESATSPQRMMWPGNGAPAGARNVKLGGAGSPSWEDRGGGGRRLGSLRLIAMPQQQPGTEDNVASLAHRSDRLVSVVYGQ